MVSPCTEMGKETGSKLWDVNQLVQDIPDQPAYFFEGVTLKEYQVRCPML